VDTVTFFFKAVPCQRYFGGNIVMGANFLRKNVTFSATLFVAIKHPSLAHICEGKNNKNVPYTHSFQHYFGGNIVMVLTFCTKTQFFLKHSF
jgi:hypothetical protein